MTLLKTHFEIVLHNIMARSYFLSITFIVEYFKDNIIAIILYNHNLGIVAGEIKPSMRNGSSKVQIYLKDGSITEA